MRMLSPRWVNIYGYLFLAVILAMLALVWFQIVPERLYMPLFLVALVLYLIRITLRLLLQRQLRLQEREKKAGVSTMEKETKQE